MFCERMCTAVGSEEIHLQNRSIKTRASDQSTWLTAVLSGISMTLILTTTTLVGGESHRPGRAEHVIAHPTNISARVPLWLRVKKFVNAPYCMPAPSASAAIVPTI